jgi:hypothetical protein
MKKEQEFDLEAYKAEGYESAQEFMKKYDAMCEKYPNYRDADDIECLNLIMKREFAEAIVRGEKKVEFRAMSDSYMNRLYDDRVLQFMDLHEDDPLVQECAEPMRNVKTIHFHNYNNSWTLDVECELNDIVVVNDEQVKYMQEEYGCHELDAQLKATKKSPNKPMYFYFVIGKIINRVNI